MTYTELVTAVESYTQNYEDTFVATIPTFVQQAEARIYNTVLFPALRKTASSTITAYGAFSNPRAMYLNCPNDFLSVFSLSVTGYTSNVTSFLLNKDTTYLQEAYPIGSTTGTPQFYCLFGPTVSSGLITTELTFLMAPAPDAQYTAQLSYYYYPDSIVTAGTSWVGDNYSPVLLYATLVEAYIFMKGEADMMAVYEKKYEEATSQLIRLGAALERGDVYRDGQSKIKVSP